MIELSDRSLIPISKIRVGEKLKNNEQVLGIVEIWTDQMCYYKLEDGTILGSNRDNINIRFPYAEKLKSHFEHKVYHLLTNTKSFLLKISTMMILKIVLTIFFTNKIFYNIYMEFKVLGYKLQLEVVIACMILGCLICTLTICSCSKVGVKEGFAMLQNRGLSNILQNLEFKPECCPSTYSNSSGCLYG